MIPKAVIPWFDPVHAALLSASHSEIEPTLILAIVWQESAGDQFALRPEPKYRWFWNVAHDQPFRKPTEAEIASKYAPSDFPYLAGGADQEWCAQQASWGLLQLMGAAAREQGFKGGYLTELTEPYTNLKFGIKHLWNYAMQYGNRSIEDGLQRWNGGGNKNYASEVIAKQKELENALS